MNLDEEKLKEHLEQLRLEHRDLDEAIDHMLHSGTVDMLKMQRMKKRKLALRDMISKIESMLIPDIIA